MELYLFRPKQHYRLYGCANITVEDVPLEKRQHITEGVIIIALTATYYILYVPCILSMYQHLNIHCYKILLYISIIDCSILWLIGFVHGYFAIVGVVYCSHPTLIYFLGCYIWGIWIFQTSAQITLVINRCVALLSFRKERMMFEGWRIYFWIGKSILLGFYFFFYSKPLLFTGIHFSWFFNPYVGYQDNLAANYINNLHLIWDGGFSIAIPTLYIVFSLLFIAKFKKLKGDIKISRLQKLMLLQVFIISVLNLSTVSLYVAMMFIVPNEFIIHFAHFSWFHIHEEHHRLYGCANITVEDVPLEKRQHITEGVITIVLCAIYYILYIPCIPSIYRHMNNPCYKILFYISMVDVLMIWIPGFLHGYLAIIGAVFCSYPTFIYLVACYAMRRRLYIWFGASFVWAIYWWLFVTPVLFTGIYFSWFVNPYVGYRDDFNADYVTITTTVWDSIFAVTVPILYLIFAVLFFGKSFKLKSSAAVSRQQKMLLLQVFIISLLNFTTTSIYVSMMYIVPNEFVIHLGQFCWLHLHGLPPVVFLLFNSTMREDSYKMLNLFINKENKKFTTGLAASTSKLHFSNTKN